MAETILLPVTGEIIRAPDECSSLLNREIGAWISRGYVPLASGGTLNNLVWGATISPSLKNGQVQILVISGDVNTTLNAPTDATAGSVFSLFLTNSTGGTYTSTFSLSGLGGTIEVPGNGGTALFSWMYNGSTWQQLTVPTAGSSAPSGPAGGDLGGTYPNPTALKTNGVAFGTAATHAATDFDAAGSAAAAQAAAEAASDPVGSAAAAQSAAEAASVPLILSKTIPSSQVSTDHTFVQSEEGTCKELTGATGRTFTVDSAQTYDTDAYFQACQTGTGQITVAAAGTFVLVSNGSKVKSAAQGSTIGIRRSGSSNNWYLSGDLA